MNFDNYQLEVFVENINNQIQVYQPDTHGERMILMDKVLRRNVRSNVVPRMRFLGAVWGIIVIYKTIKNHRDRESYLTTLLRVTGVDYLVNSSGEILSEGTEITQSIANKIKKTLKLIEGMTVNGVLKLFNCLSIFFQTTELSLERLYYRKEGRYRNFQKPVNTHKLSEGIVIPMVVIRSTSVPQTNNKNDGLKCINIPIYRNTTDKNSSKSNSNSATPTSNNQRKVNKSNTNNNGGTPTNINLSKHSSTNRNISKSKSNNPNPTNINQSKAINANNSSVANKKGSSLKANTKKTTANNLGNTSYMSLYNSMVNENKIPPADSPSKNNNKSPTQKSKPNN